MNVLTPGTCDFCGSLRRVAQSPIERKAPSLVWPQICEQCCHSSLRSFRDALKKSLRERGRREMRKVRKR